ncbi:MAG TPA: serine/threonine-protein kinase [Gemmatimonadales bacterium]|nr:serine/threonine-protein kinase [Gemmatimonadales bacterium]
MRVEPERAARPTPPGGLPSLPPALLERVRVRLGIVALIYSGVYFAVGWLPPLLFAPAELIGHLHASLPKALSILAGLGVALLTRRNVLPIERIGLLAVTFEVLSSFGITFAEYQHIAGGIQYQDGSFGGLGLSWVAPWVVFFSVVVPAPPRRALPAAILASSAAPVAYAVGMVNGINLQLTPFYFFFGLVLPYIAVAFMGYVGSRIVHRLVTEVGRARELGSYRLVERLGGGGMGEVWRAQHRLLARPAAIKLISPAQLGDMGSERRETMLARFEREAQATAAMRSPHTVELYDFGRAGDGAFYYVMELLDGLDAQTLVDRHGPLPAERVTYLLRQACHSLGEAHDQGLIHRDVKPANVFVCRYGRELDWVKLLDFGLVKGSPDQGRDPRLTGEGYVGGTPDFMAPEQVLGDRPVDGRADIYALGCVAYWLLTGHTVFRGANAVATMMQHVQETPEPPSRRTELCIPAELDRTVLQCLEKDPARRPATADELSAQLAEVPLAQPWTPERARRWWEMHRPAERRTSGPVRGGAAIWPQRDSGRA